MNSSTWKHRTALIGLTASLIPLAAVGCQSSIAGQTLPSPYYLRDDVQYFIHGPEYPLPNQARVIEEYQVREAARAAGVEQGLGPAGP
jgi:hypothetical protein